LLVVLGEAALDSRKRSKLGETDAWISYQESIQTKGGQRFDWRTLPESMAEAVTELKLNHTMKLVVKSVKKLKRPTRLVVSPKKTDSGSKMIHDQMKLMKLTVGWTLQPSEVAEN